MYLYLISQTENDDYDTYDSAVVLAPDADVARHIHPRKGLIKAEEFNYRFSPWCYHPDKVTVQLLGTSIELPNPEPQVILASFNAG